MNDKPKSIWKKSRNLPGSFFGWLILVCCLVAGVALLETLIIHGSRWRENLGPAAAVTAIAAAGSLLFLLARWLCRWRNLKRFLFGVACFVTLLALVATEENWRGKRAWTNFKGQWEAKGEKFAVPEFAPPPVPDDKNFAMTPLLKSALAFVRTTNGFEWRDTNAYAHLENFRTYHCPPGWDKARLVTGNLIQGTLADLEVCRDFYRGNTNYPQPARPGTAAEDILVALGKFDADLKELDEAAATRPYSRFPVEYNYEPVAAILLPHLGELIGIAQVVQLRAVALLESGQPGRAFEDLKLGFRLSDSIKDETMLIDHLVRLAVLDLDLRTVREGLARHAWTDAQLAEVDNHLRSLDLLAELKHAFRGERALAVDNLNYLRRQGSVNPDDRLGGPKPVRKLLSVVLSGFFYQNMLTIAKMHQESSLPSIDAKARRIFPEIAEGFEKQINAMHDHGFHPYSMFAFMLLPAIATAELKSAHMQTFVDEARVACALERYRLANGRFPEKLDALVPQFISAIPTDVIDGQPLRYRQTQDGYVLYSVGWNKTDDGGKLAWTQETRPSVDNKRGDWVWQYPAK